MKIQEIAGRHVVRVATPAGWATAGTASDFPAFRAPHKIKIEGARLLADAAITGDGTHYATVAVNNGAVVLASKAYDTPTDDDVAALGASELTLNATEDNRVVDAGDVVDVEKAVTGNGLAVSGVIEIEYSIHGA